MSVCDVFIPTLRGRGRGQGRDTETDNHQGEGSDVDNEKSVSAEEMLSSKSKSIVLLSKCV